MAQMYFNAKGATHTLRILPYDSEDVWEALVDGSEYYYFEAHQDSEIWQLFSLAISAYLGYRDGAEVERRDWHESG